MVMKMSEMKTPDVEVKHNSRGYYTLYIRGMFAGNFDTMSEALDEYNSIMKSENDLSALMAAT